MDFIKLAIFVCFVIATSNAQREKKFFRNDYEFVEATQSFYKVHTIPKNFQEAQMICRLEGATLYYPDTRTEANSVLQLWKRTERFHTSAFVGITALFAERQFYNLGGHLVTGIDDLWSPKESCCNNDDCVIWKRDGRMISGSCEQEINFLCKKTLATLNWNHDCGIPYMDYQLDTTTKKCYKFHLHGRTWQEAQDACTYEKSSLAVINSQQEATSLARISAAAPIEASTGVGIDRFVWLGFRKDIPGVWWTSEGTKLENSGYSWTGGEPNNADGRENCGSMYFNAILNDLACDQKTFSICEHNV